MKQHPLYKHLFITEDGEIYSNKSKKFLKTFINKKSYEVFATRLNGRESNCILLRVHRLVAETYIDNPENKPQVNHKDGVKNNNHYSNLEWSTAQENINHAIETGLWKPLYGFDNPNSKIKEEDLQEIIKLIGVKSYRQIAKLYNVTHGTISRCARSRIRTDMHKGGEA